MRNIKIQVLIAFLLSFFSLNASIKDEVDSVRVKRRQNSMRLEIGAKSPFFGLLYERKLLTKKWSTYISIGTGFGDTRKLYPYPTMFNTSVYLTCNAWKIKPILGLGAFVWVEYRPYPSTVVERTLFRKTGGDGGPPLAPPFNFFETAILGAEIEINTRWNCQLLYTHYFGYDFIIGKYEGSAPFGGINFGYNF